MVRWKNRSTRILGLISILAFALANSVAAQDAKKGPGKGGHQGDLTTAATNPVGSLIQVQLQDL
jgi:hypothetical protein